jgi:hypothetical protein
LATYSLALLPPGFSRQSVAAQSVYFVQLGPAERRLAIQSLEKLYMDSGPGQWQLINPHIELVVSQSVGVVQAFLLATTNLDEFVKDGTNAASDTNVPAKLYQLAPP